MIDERERYERAFGLFEMPEPSFERLVRRRDRKRRNQRLVAALMALVVAGAAGVLLGRTWFAGRPRPADDTSRQAVVATIPVDGNPVHVAVGEGAVWVAGDSVSRVDPATNKVVAAFAGESRREGTAIAVGEGAVWVSGGAFDGEVIRIDPGSGEVTTIHAGYMYDDPYAVAVGAGSVWATSDHRGTLQQIDPATKVDAVATTIAVGQAYGVTVLDGTVWVVTRVTVGGGAELVGVDPVNGAVVATFLVDMYRDVTAGFDALWAPGPERGADARVVRVDPSTGSILATVEIPYVDETPPSFLLGRPKVAVGEGAVWVAVTDWNADGSARGRILRIDSDTNEIVGEVALETPAIGLAAGAGAVWVTDGLGTLVRIDPDAVVGETAPTQSPAPAASPTPSEPPISSSGPVVASITVSGLPAQMAVGVGAVWMTDEETGVLWRVDPATNEAVAVIELGVSGGTFYSVAVGEGAVWVASDQDGGVFRVDPATNEVVAFISFPYPAGIAVGAGAVWLLTNYDPTGTPVGTAIVRIDPATNAEAATIPLGTSANGYGYEVAVLDGTIWAIVDHPAFGELVGVDAASGAVVSSFRIDDSGLHGRVAAGFGSLWTAADGGAQGRILRLDPSTGAVLATVEVPARGGGPLIAVGEGAVWIAVTDHDQGDPVAGRVLRIDPDTNAVVGEVVVGPSAGWLASGVGAVWVTDYLGHLLRIDPDAVKSS